MVVGRLSRAQIYCWTAAVHLPSAAARKRKTEPFHTLRACRSTRVELEAQMRHARSSSLRHVEGMLRRHLEAARLPAALDTCHHCPDRALRLPAAAAPRCRLLRHRGRCCTRQPAVHRCSTATLVDASRRRSHRNHMNQRCPVWLQTRERAVHPCSAQLAVSCPNCRGPAQ